VESILELNSDLNIELSPIRYDGPVVIKGDVLSGATIECQDILVSGMIENNVHFLCKGDVEVAGGIVGDDTKIEAKNIKARHVQSATLISSTSVEIKSFVYGAKIYAMGSIFIHGEKLPEKNNALVGGVCSAFESIQVHSVGSEMNATVICAGVDLRLWESCEQAKSLARSLKQEVQVIQKDLPIDDLQKHGIDALDSERKSLVTHQLKDIQKKLSQRQRLLDRLNTEKEQCFNVNREKIFISMNKGFSPDVMVMVCGEQKILRKSKSGQLCLKAVGQNIELNSQSSNGSSS
jgi:uncharacterized protein (DUF342 family)